MRERGRERREGGRGEEREGGRGKREGGRDGEITPMKACFMYPTPTHPVSLDTRKSCSSCLTCCTLRGDSHVHTHTYIHTYTRTYIHTYTHTYIHPYTHTYIHPYKMQKKNANHLAATKWSRSPGRARMPVH